MYDRNLSEELRMMRQSCREFVDAVVLPFIKENWKQEWSMVPEDRLPPHLLEEAEKIGIRTLGVPEEYGGVELEKGTEVRTFAVVSEEIARGDSGLADKMVQNWKVSVLLRQFAPKHLQEKWFKRLVAEPQFLMAHCLTEPRGGSDAANLIHDANPPYYLRVPPTQLEDKVPSSPLKPGEVLFVPMNEEAVTSATKLAEELREKLTSGQTIDQVIADTKDADFQVSATEAIKISDAAGYYDEIVQAADQLKETSISQVIRLAP